MPVPAVERLHLDLKLDERAIARRIGLITLATDHTTEADFRRMAASDAVGIFATRVEYANPTTPANLRRMQPKLAAAAALILPDEPLDVIYFGCSSASVVIGDAAVEAAIREGKPGVPVVTPPSAAIAGLRTLGARRISLLTPYTVETTTPMAAYFAGHGFEIASVCCLGLDDDRDMARLSLPTLVKAAVTATAADADALFISCTAVRSALVAAEIEQAIGRPVVTSNQAGAWACLNLIGCTPDIQGYGRLMQAPYRHAA